MSEKAISDAVRAGADLQRKLDESARGVVLERERAIVEAAAQLRNAVYEALPRPYPNWWFGGGSAMERAAQDRWEREYGAGADYVRISRDAVERVFKLLNDLPEAVNARGVELARAKKDGAKP